MKAIAVIFVTSTLRLADEIKSIIEWAPLPSTQVDGDQSQSRGAKPAQHVPKDKPTPV